LKERSAIVASSRVLAKPFTIEQLAAAIRETLDTPRMGGLPLRS
jgi:hypothetical protein